MQITKEVPKGTEEVVQRKMQSQGIAARVTSFVAAAAIGMALALSSGQSWIVSAIYGLTAGVFVMGAVTFITAINTQATIAKQRQKRVGSEDVTND